jgi:outer membrane receptor protein involved in Fe transport
MVQAKYKLADWGDVRYSYTQTLARPDYSELSPHFNIVANTYNTVWAGNPNLKPGKAFNHDLMLTLHSNELGLLSVGAFYKTIDRFTYPIAYNIYDNPKVAPPGFDSTGSFNLPNNNGRPVNGAMLYTYINSPYKAYVKGIEADFQTRLWYLPSPMNGIVLGVNYTLISSSTLYPLDTITNVVDSVVGRRTFSHPVVINSTRGGRLIFQPNDIVNTYLGYDYKGFSARVSFVFQGSSLTGVGARPETDGFSNNYFRIDASARQMLPWAGLQLYLDANNLNSESNISTQQSIGGFTSEQYYGLTADLGVRLTL